MWELGVGYRRPLHTWIKSRPQGLQYLELTAEHFIDSSLRSIEMFKDHYKFAVHGLGLSLGSPGKLDSSYLLKFRNVVKAVDPDWVSEHIAFTKTDFVDLGHLNPVFRTKESLIQISEKAKIISDFCEKPILLENITTHLDPGGSISETDFINEILLKSGAELLLDVTNLFVNSRNFGFDPMSWVKAINPEKIIQLHLVGYSYHDGIYFDTHSSDIQEELFLFLKEILEYATPSVIVVERDANFQAIKSFVKNLETLRLIQ